MDGTAEHTTERSAQQRMEALRLFAMNTRMDALDGLRAETRATRPDDRPLLYFQRKMDERLGAIQGGEALSDPAAEAARQRYRTGMGAIDAASAQDLPNIIADQQRVLAERLARDGVDYNKLGGGGREALPDAAIQNLSTIEDALIQREMFQGIRRDILFQDPQYRDETRTEIDAMLQRIEGKLAPFALADTAMGARAEKERNPVTLLPPEFPPYADEIAPQAPDMQGGKGLFVPVPPGSQPFLPPAPDKGEQRVEELPPPSREAPGVELLPPPPPEEKPDPASRDMKDLEKILGPRLRKGPGMNYKERVPEPGEGEERPPKIAGEFDTLKRMSDAALASMAGSLPSSGEPGMMETGPGAIPGKTGGRSLA